MKPTLVKLVATGLYTGHLRPYPGTWGTLPAWIIAYFLIGPHNLAMLIAAVTCTNLSVWAADEGEKIYGHDAKTIVIDEWAGMFIAVLFLPFSLLTFGLAFFAFRFFDVVKLPPAYQAERLRGGWGITMDDVVAGIYANFAVRLIMFVAERYFDYSMG